MPFDSLLNPLMAANRAGYAIAGLNVDSLEMAQGVLEGATRADSPIFLQVTQETLEIWGFSFWVAMIRELVTPLTVPVSLHLDHATDLTTIRVAIASGFTSVMYDGSALPFEDNVTKTRQVVSWARPQGVLVEGEIGHVAKPGEPEDWAHLTSPEEARDFAQQTGVDALAVAIGTHHATRVGSGAVDLPRLEAIHHACAVPLVLHGSSGVPVDLYPELCRRGIAKMNFGTELRRIWWQEINDHEGQKPRLVLAEIRSQIAAWATQTIMACRTPEQR